MFVNLEFDNDIHNKLFGIIQPLKLITFGNDMIE